MEKQQPGIMAFAGLGLLNAICLVAGLALGWFLDREFGSSPLFLLLGLAGGIGCGILATRSEWKKYS